MSTRLALLMPAALAATKRHSRRAPEQAPRTARRGRAGATVV